MKKRKQKFKKKIGKIEKRKKRIKNKKIENRKMKIEIINQEKNEKFEKIEK